MSTWKGGVPGASNSRVGGCRASTLEQARAFLRDDFTPDELELLAGPLGGWVAGNVKVEDATTIMGQDQKHVEDLKTDGRDRKEIDRNQL